MKKRVISLFCAALCMLAAFAFAGCTDKPRKLDDVEKSIVGEWRDADGWGFNFNADGTYTTTNGNRSRADERARRTVRDHCKQS